MVQPTEQPVEQATNPNAAMARLEYLEKCMAHQENVNTTIGASLDKIMEKLNNLPLPEDPSPAHTAKPTASVEATTEARNKESKLKPSPPADFDGDRAKGQTFLNQDRKSTRL